MSSPERLKCAYSDVGTGTTIVFVHGLGSRKEAWANQLPLARNYRLIAIDLRGHGETEMADQITIKNFASDIAELMDDLKIKEAYICGLSLGGIIAQELYIQRPDLVKGLILASTTSYIPPLYVHGMISQTEKAFKSGKLIDDIIDRGLVDKSFKEEARDAFYIRECYMDAARSAIGLNYFPALGRIKKPVLLIASLQDQVIPVVNLFYMQMWMPHAKSKMFFNSGHLVNIEQAEKFNESISEFIG